MKKTGIEIKVTILAIFIVAAVVMSAYLVHKSLTQIVNSIQNEASPDYRLIVIKDIALDLLEIENNIQLYTLTKDRSNLKNYVKVNKRVKNRVAILTGLSNSPNEKLYWNDSVKYLVEEKLNIWEEIKQIHTVQDNPQPQFAELYSLLEKKEIDTLKVEVVIEPLRKKGFFKKIFGKKDSATIRIDTTFVEKSVENEEIRKEIKQLETDLKQKEQKKNKRELELIEQNIQATRKLNNLIVGIEKAEKDNLIEKTDEADRLATLIYKRLSAFSIMAVVLLFVILYLFVRYLQKAKVYQRVLTTAKLEAERLASAKEVFVANISHEMRTPVNAIYGLTEQLLLHKTNAKIKEQLAVVLKSAKHLKQVVNDTLDFSKIQANKLKIKEIDFSAESIIREIIDLHKAEAAIKNIDLVYRFITKLPPALLGDPFRLKQILINTLGNAIKFTEKGSVTLLVKSQKININQFHLYFYIEDTGIGISTENMKLIFEDFVQVESDYTRKFSGTGLGLSIVKKLIELQNGKISIESELGSGTTISFHIPYKLGSLDNIEQLTQQEIIIPEKIKELKILGVDDEEFNRYLLKVIFEKWGVAYQEAKNGKEAVKMAVESNFDLILMDVRMPELNGIEASKLILKEKSLSHIIAVAAVNTESEMKLCSEAGMISFLSKPFSEFELFNMIVSALKISNENDSLSTKEFELEELERLANGDPIFMKEMIQIFIRSTRAEIKNINVALKNENWQEISDAAHKIAPPCKHIKASELYKKIKQLEKNTNDLESLQSVPELISFIEHKVEKINSSLSRLIESGRFDS